MVITSGGIPTHKFMKTCKQIGVRQLQLFSKTMSLKLLLSVVSLLFFIIIIIFLNKKYLDYSETHITTDKK